MFGFYDTYFKFFGLSITYYGLIVTIAMLCGVLIACKISKLRGLTSEDILLLACYVLPLAVIGARLYYVAFSGQNYTFLEILQVWNGGLAVYGGVIGGALAIVLYCAIHKKNFFDVTDIAVVALILGQGIGRIACYFGHCCYGIEVTNESLQWFPLSVYVHGAWHYSTFFYESFCNFMIFGVLLFLLTRKVSTRGVISSLYLICYGTIRCLIETIRGDSLYIGIFKVSQLLSALIVLAGIIMLIVIYVKKSKKIQ